MNKIKQMKISRTNKVIIIKLGSVEADEENPRISNNFLKQFLKNKECQQEVKFLTFFGMALQEYFSLIIIFINLKKNLKIPQDILKLLMME